jgi:hypothetical protein
MQLQLGILPWSSSCAVNSSSSDSSIAAKLWAPFRNTTTSNATSGVHQLHAVLNDSVSFQRKCMVSWSNTPYLPIVKVSRNPQGAERLPPGIVVSESDLHLRRLWGSPTKVLISLVTSNLTSIWIDTNWFCFFFHCSLGKIFCFAMYRTRRPASTSWRWRQGIARKTMSMQLSRR